MQGQGGEQLYKGPLDAVKKLYQQGGLRSIYRGTGATLARDGPGSAAYFLAYEAIKKQLTPAGQDPASLSLSAVVLAGGFAGVTMWTFAIPPDVRSFYLYSSLPTCTDRPLNYRSSSLVSRERPRERTRASSTARQRRSRLTDLELYSRVS